MFNSLMEWGDDLRVHPALADGLENPDPLTYVAHLRRGVRFHDGHELTSRDVVYTFQAFLDPAFVSPLKGAYKLLRSVTALDDYTVRFTLAEPFAAFPIQLVLPPIVPADAGDRMRTSPDRHRAVSVRALRRRRQGRAVGVRRLLERAAQKRRRRREGRSPTTRCAASICARAPPTWSSTTCRPTSSTS